MGLRHLLEGRGPLGARLFAGRAGSASTEQGRGCAVPAVCILGPGARASWKLPATPDEGRGSGLSPAGAPWRGGEREGPPKAKLGKAAGQTHAREQYCIRITYVSPLPEEEQLEHT